MTGASVEQLLTLHREVATLRERLVEAEARRDALWRALEEEHTAYRFSAHSSSCETCALLAAVERAQGGQSGARS